MKSIHFTLIAVVVLGLGGYGLYQFGMQQGMKHAQAPSTSMAAGSEKKVLYWHDPMVPGHKFDKPGKSPFMDMQLVPVYAESGNEAGSGGVNINPQVQQNLGIRSAEVVRGSLNTVLTAVGNVAYNERDTAMVQARSNGFVEKLWLRAPLDPVRKGQILAELYVPDWVAAQEEFLLVRRMQAGTSASANAAANADVRSSLLDAARQRMRLVGMSNEQIRLVENGGKLLTHLPVTAPIDGVVAELSVREGMTVMTGTPLFRINGLRSIWVNADIAENASGQLRPGIPVQARTPALPGVLFTGKLNAILPQVDSTTRTLKARIELQNPQQRLVPGMTVTLDFAVPVRSDVLLVPSEAVIVTGTRSVVMVAQEGGKFSSVDVETGGESQGQTEIRKGLQAGQKVVVSGQFLIDSEASLKGSGTRMEAASAPASASTSASVPASASASTGAKP